MSNILIKSAYRLSFVLALLAAFILVTPQARAQESTSEQTEIADAKAEDASPDSATVTPIITPVLTDYRGVQIAMSADEVRSKLDHQKVKDKEQDLFVFSEKESAQVYYDEQGKVKAIAVTYATDRDAPTPQAVLGKEVQPKADGSIYELVRYADAGYWVAYSRTAGESPTITVTMQKLR